MKDYKTRTVKKKSKGSTLLGIFIGLALGLLIAVGIALYVSKIPSPFDDTAKALPKPAETKPAPTPPAPEEKRFDFYRILPGQEVPVSEKELKQEQSKSAAKNNERKEPYLIQAGAFQSPTDADALKARLALLGLESSVEPVHLEDKGTLYRVRLGPYTDLEEINQVRQALAHNGINAALVKSRKE
jgi:cell division protein FtsN